MEAVATGLTIPIDEGYGELCAFFFYQDCRPIHQTDGEDRHTDESQKKRTVVIKICRAAAH